MQEVAKAGISLSNNLVTLRYRATKVNTPNVLDDDRDDLTEDGPASGLRRMNSQKKFAKSNKRCSVRRRFQRR